MKKFIALITLALLAFCFVPQVTNAQIRRTITPTKDSISGTDTMYANFTGASTMKSFTVYLTRASGYIRGKIYLMGSVNSSTYDKIDSLTVTNLAAQNKTFNAGASNGYLIYRYYRFQFLSDTSGVQKAVVYQLER
jgi:hypothetical protein